MKLISGWFQIELSKIHFLYVSSFSLYFEWNYLNIKFWKTVSSFGNQIFGLTYKNQNNLSGYGSLISYESYDLIQENLVLEAKNFYKSVSIGYITPSSECEETFSTVLIFRCMICVFWRQSLSLKNIRTIFQNVMPRSQPSIPAQDEIVELGEIGNYWI